MDLAGTLTVPARRRLDRRAPRAPAAAAAIMAILYERRAPRTQPDLAITAGWNSPPSRRRMQPPTRCRATHVGRLRSRPQSPWSAQPGGTTLGLPPLRALAGCARFLLVAWPCVAGGDRIRVA